MSSGITAASTPIAAMRMRTGLIPVGGSGTVAAASFTEDPGGGAGLGSASTVALALVISGTVGETVG